jgi:hypothetical protein
MGLLAAFTGIGRVVFGVLIVGPLAVGCLLSIPRFSAYLRAGMFLAGPLAAFIAWEIINPDPGCTYDCPGKLAWGLTLSFATLAWWAGVLAGMAIGWAKGRRRSSN